MTAKAVPCSAASDHNELAIVPYVSRLYVIFSRLENQLGSQSHLRDFPWTEVRHGSGELKVSGHTKFQPDTSFGKITLNFGICPQTHVCLYCGCIRVCVRRVYVWCG